MTILLLGMMGVGKTSVGQALAAQLHFNFYEQDVLTLDRTGYESVEAVFQRGLSVWKEAELEISKELSYESDLVLACSGSVIDEQLNLIYFRENAADLMVVYLHATPSVILSRLESKHSSLELANLAEKIENLYTKRDSAYRAIATLVVETDGRTPEQSLAGVLAGVAVEKKSDK